MMALTNSALIAPCGINCGVCRAHMRKRNPCPGCRADDAGKPKTRVLCRIKTCEKRVGGRDYCFSCTEFPCKNISRLDERYRTRYSMSVIGNLLMINDCGITKFVASEKHMWTCSGAAEHYAFTNRSAEHVAACDKQTVVPHRTGTRENQNKGSCYVLG